MTSSRTSRLRRRIFFTVAVSFILLLGTFYRPDIPLSELLDTYTDSSSQFLDFGGRPLHFRDQGKGPPLVLLHGTAASLHTWDPWVEILQDRHRIIRLDLPGFGLTGPGPEHDHTTEGCLKAIRALTSHLGIERFALAGSSLGGFLAWRYALEHPEQVENLVLIDAAGLAPVDPEISRSSIFDLGRIPVLKDLLSRFTPRFLVSRGLRQVYGDPSSITEEQIDRYYDLLLRAGNRQALVESLNRPRRSRSATDLTTFSNPTLILWGEVDPWIPVADAFRFQALLPTAKVIVYPGIGHVLMEEIPQRSAEDVAKFLAHSPGASKEAASQSQ